jgi:hypothetical protein
MVALGEKGDGIDVAKAEGLLELRLVEARADALDVWRRMEVQVDLPEA